MAGRAERGPSFPWLWLLPSVAVLAGLVIWGIAVYPELPRRVPQHIGPDGVDAYAAKSIWSVFLPVFVYAGVIVVIALTAAGVLRTRPAAEAGRAEGFSRMVSRPATRAGALRVAKATLFLGACLGLTFAGSCAVMWRTGNWTDPPVWVLFPVLAPVLLGSVPLLVVASRDRRDVESGGGA